MANEHNGRFGKFYSAWAFDENEDAMMDANRNVYEALHHTDDKRASFA